MPTLQWREPAKYRRLSYWRLERANPWRSLKLGGFTFCTVMILRATVGVSPDPNRHPPDWTQSTMLGISTALIVAYGMPFGMGYIANSIVIISDKGVNCNSTWGGANIRFWPWDKIALGYVWRDMFGGDSFVVLSICDEQGVVLHTLALSDRVTMQEIESAFVQRGIEFRQEIGV